LVLAAIAVAATLYVLADILIPFVLAAFLSVLYRPFIIKLRSWGAPTWLGLIIVLIISGGAIYGMSSIVSLGIESAIVKAPVYAEKMNHLIADLQATTNDFSLRLLGSGTTTRLIEMISPEHAVQFVSTWLGSAIAIMADGALVIIFLIFMVMGSEHFPAKLEAAFRGTRAFPLVDVYHKVNSKVLNYLRVKTLFNLINGIVVFVILTLFDVDFAPVLALLTFLFTYIPNIGSFITTAFPFVVSIVQFEDLGYAFSLLVVLIIFQTLIGSVLEPRAMGDRLDLSPVVVLFALVFWGWMWGIVGMILSVPIVAIIKAVLENFPSTRPIAVLMGSKKSAQRATDEAETIASA
jgi:AI-2 transport protein TqsA